ncbi:MAG: diheme cytochrome c [Rhodoferax sp.]|nr:diheme cytochrome c [Rhodoferax sp.]
MKNNIASMRLRAALLTSCAAVGLARTAHADFGRSNPAPLPLYKTECAACHIAYPAGMLPAQSWQQLMAHLPKHFGTDASLDAATTTQISTWLQANAGTGRRFSEAPPDHRISKSAWFVRQHDEVSAAVFKRASVGGAANCGACHGHAADGNFNEHDVRIPK